MEMNFRQASEIAKQNPGSTLTRDSSGGFVVLSEDGAVLAGGDSGVQSHTAGRTKESYESELARLRQELDSVRTENVDQQRKLKELEQEVADKDKNNEELKSKLARVTEKEWEAIRKREADEQNRYAEERHNERRTVKCACMGEVENCARCYGRGTYVTDGYGNIV